MSRAFSPEYGLGDEARPEIQILGPHDWSELRAARLLALADSPEAFTTSFAAEVAQPTTYWVDLLEKSTWVAACRAGLVVGIARLAGTGHALRERFIESVWVSVELRRRGLVRRMLGALEIAARIDGAEWLKLWVLDTNMTAADAYEKLGFFPVPGSWQVSPKQRHDGSPVREFQMIMPIFP